MMERRVLQKKSPGRDSQKWKSHCQLKAERVDPRIMEVCTNPGKNPSRAPQGYRSDCQRRAERLAPPILQRRMIPETESEQRVAKKEELVPSASREAGPTDPAAVRDFLQQVLREAEEAFPPEKRGWLGLK